MNTPALTLNQRQYLELEKLAFGAFAPLDGFMDATTFTHVVDGLRLPSGAVFPLPVVLDMTAEDARRCADATGVVLQYEGVDVGWLEPTGAYHCDREAAALAVYGTADRAHPGVDHFHRLAECFVGGRVRLDRRAAFEFAQYERTPVETRALFAARGWSTVAGFQTRNVPHRAHEYLQRLALEHVDGLFIQPLVGSKKAGDYAPAAILAGYRTLIDQFLPADRVWLGVLSTSMRYAGPREAVFHALVRRNYGCTHFIVGRDHAGVGSYYGLYEAQALAQRLQGDLGITILNYAGPFYCEACDGMATDRTCPHLSAAPHLTHQVSGTLIRRILAEGAIPDLRYIRPAVVESLYGLPLFIEEGQI
ncbi:MAG: sulfate adenylyltransferase [Acidimicrobiia bacterium]|nr:sulfate adenylyltransferase [Acidimicrobiia bacterium]